MELVEITIERFKIQTYLCIGAFINPPFLMLTTHLLEIKNKQAEMVSYKR